jgi:hypothetical protein
LAGAKYITPVKYPSFSPFTVLASTDTDNSFIIVSLICSADIFILSGNYGGDVTQFMMAG